MNDPIADICLKWMMKFARHDDGNPALAAKEIRQQIGRELLDVRNVEVNFEGYDTVTTNKIREVCKMEESK